MGLRKVVISTLLIVPNIVHSIVPNMCYIVCYSDCQNISELACAYLSLDGGPLTPAEAAITGFMWMLLECYRSLCEVPVAG